jgi:AAA15 family ATPase/GTPase
MYDKYSERASEAVLPREKEGYGMLVSFTVKNYACFDEEAKITFRASAAESDTSVKLSKNISVVTRIALLGANASGKSKALRALNTLVELVNIRSSFFKDIEKRGFEPHLPFCFCAKNEKLPTFYEAIFFIKETDENKEGAFYKYSVEIGESGVVSETLYVVDDSEDYNHLDIVFSRDKEKVRVSESLSATIKASQQDSTKKISDTGELGKSKVQMFLDMINSVFFKETLLLGLLKHYIKAEPVCSIVSWFNNYVYIGENDPTNDDSLSPEKKRERFAFLRDNPKYEREFLDYVNKVDSMIKDVKFEEIKNQSGELIEFGISTVHEYSAENGKKPKEYHIDIESEGTRKLIYFFPQLFSILKKGGMLIIDEMDARYHPLLLEDILRMFSDKSMNIDGKAQIVFSAHNGFVLTFMRYDEIYLVDKDERGKSGICSLMDYYDDDERLRDKKIVTECKHNWYVDYLNGRYNAVPDLEDE